MSCIVASLSVACAAPVDETPCDRASAAVDRCATAPVPTPFSARCGPDEARAAENVLAQLEIFGCEGSPDAADGFFCDWWDPFDWCDTPEDDLFPRPSGSPTQYPILLAHGFNTSTTNFWRFNEVDTALRADGHTVTLGSVPPFDASASRARFLATDVDALLRQTGASKVNLICFSQGGVDCRFLVSPAGLNYGDRVASVSLISAPNRGTYVGDVAIQLLPEANSATGRAIDTVASWYGATFSELAADSHFINAMASMSEAGMAEFNQTYPDAPYVFYQSWAGFSYPGGLPNHDSLREDCRDEFGTERMIWHEGQHDITDLLLAPGVFVVGHGAELLPNDGVSTVRSSKWGLFRGCIPADHLDQVGQVDDTGTNTRTGFNYLSFYRTLAFELAERGY